MADDKDKSKDPESAWPFLDAALRGLQQGGGATEPDANAREFARMMRGHFVAFVNEGFNEQQALKLVRTEIATVLGRP